jgi:hypothetical protein
VGSTSVRSGTRHRLVHGMEGSHSDSIPRAATMPASPTSRIPMAAPGCYRNEATARRDRKWKLRAAAPARDQRLKPTLSRHTRFPKADWQGTTNFPERQE